MYLMLKLNNIFYDVYFTYSWFMYTHEVIRQETAVNVNNVNTLTKKNYMLKCIYFYPQKCLNQKSNLYYYPHNTTHVFLWNKTG